mmetsp:Transcript_22633/g.59796  ORF Transcript_22633/g.59796 Transcript_22633/m.59796 type:complete len:213 (+) Transcript_22633:872-1510(+)
MPWYTNAAPFTARLSYTQTITVLCTPSLDTWSTTYSLPFRNSWHSTAAPWLPTFCCAPIRTSKCSRASSSEWHSFTPSEPADSTGFTTTGICSVLRNSSTSFKRVPPAWRTDRSPAAFTSSCWIFLSRRCGICVPLVRTPRCSDSASARGTPDSPPTITAASSVGTTPFTAVATISIVPISVTSATYFRSAHVPGMWLFISSEISLLQTTIT